MILWIKKYKSVFTMGLFILLGIFLSLRIIGRDMWYDEAYTGIVSRMPWDVFWTKIVGDVHPPLYYIAVKLWGGVFGYSAEAIRSLSLVSYMLCIPMVYGIGTIFTKKTGYVAAVICTLSPFFVGYATEARMYMLLCLFVLIGVYSILRFLLEKQSYGWLTLSAVALGLASLTHYFGIFACAGVFFALVYTYKNKLTSWEFWKAAGIFTIICLLIFSPWISILLGQRSAVASFGWIPVTDLGRIPESLYIFMYGSELGVMQVPKANSFLLFIPGIILFSLLLVGMVKGYDKEKKTLPILSIIALTPLLGLCVMSLFGTNLYLERYLLPFGVLWIVLLVVAIQALLYVRGQIILLLLYCGSVLVFNTTMIAPSDLYPSLLSTLQKEDVIMDNPFDYTVMRFYLPDRAVFLYNKHNPEEDFSHWNVIESADVLRTIEGESGVFYVSKEDSLPVNVELQHTLKGFAIGRVR